MSASTMRRSRRSWSARTDGYACTLSSNWPALDWNRFWRCNQQRLRRVDGLERMIEALGQRVARHSGTPLRGL